MPKLKPTPLADPEQLAREYKKAQALVKVAEERAKKLKEALVEAVQQAGEPDDKGHLWLELGDGNVKYEKRRLDVLDTEAAKLLAKKYKVDVIETIEVFSEDKFLAAGFEKKIPDAAVKGCYTEKVTWALVVRGFSD